MKNKRLYMKENELITIRAGFNGECEMTMTSEDWHGVIVQLKTEIWEKSEYEEYAKWKKSNLPSDKWYVSQDKSEYPDFNNIEFEPI